MRGRPVDAALTRLPSVQASVCQKARAIPQDLMVSEDAPWFGRCGICTLPPIKRPPGSVQLFLKGLSVLLEDGSGAAQCWADGDAAWALLGAWRGARDCPEVVALVKRHGRLSVREAWVHPDDWDGSTAQQITVRGRSVLSESEAAPIVTLIQRALEQPSVVVRSSSLVQACMHAHAETPRRCGRLALRSGRMETWSRDNLLTSLQSWRSFLRTARFVRHAWVAGKCELPCGDGRIFAPLALRS